MQKVVSITSQGQLTIPKFIRDALNITQGTKAVVSVEDDSIVIQPKMSFDDLAGSINTDVKLSDKELREARDNFEKNWSPHK